MILAGRSLVIVVFLVMGVVATDQSLPLVVQGIPTGANSSCNPTDMAPNSSNACVTMRTPAAIEVGNSPWGVAVNPSTDTVYVTNEMSNTVSVINEATGIVTATIPVGVDPKGVAVNSVTNTVYVANFGSNSTTVINGDTNTVTTTITNVKNFPYGVAVDTKTNTVYVTDRGEPLNLGGPLGNVTVINGSTNTILRTLIGLNGLFSNPVGIVFNPVNDAIYVANNNDDIVSVINATTFLLAASIIVGHGPTDVAVNTNTDTVYVADSNSFPIVGTWQVSVINATSNTLKTNINDVGAQPFGVTVDNGTNTVYTANLGSNTASIIDGVTDTVNANVTVGPSPRSVAADPNTGNVYVTNNGADTVSVLHVAPPPGHCRHGLCADWVPSGPNSDNIQIQIFSSPSAEFNALNAGIIDLMDGPMVNNQQRGQCASSPNLLFTTRGFCYANGWTDVVDASEGYTDLGLPSIGPGNFFTLLNMWNQNPASFGPGIRWGFSAGTSSLNPYLATSPQEAYTLAEVYDTLLRVNPYDQAQIVSWMVNSYRFVTQTTDSNCPAAAVQCLKIALRGDVFFHDAVQATLSDVKFSFLTFLAQGSTLGSCLGANGIFDVSFSPSSLPTSLGGTEAVGQPEVGYVEFNVAPSSTALSCLASVPILPQHIWKTGGSTGPCITTGTLQCMVDPILSVADPVALGILVGSGPFLCASGPLGAPGTVIGGGCTSTSTSFVPTGGTVLLSRFGSGLTPANLAYFRNNADYAQWQWADYDGAISVDGLDVSQVISCTNAAPPLTGACAHFDTSARALTCTIAGPCIGQNSGGDNDGLVTSNEVSQAVRWFGTSWNDPVAYGGLIGVQPVCVQGMNGADAGACNGVYDDGTVYSTPPPPP